MCAAARGSTGDGVAPAENACDFAGTGREGPRAEGAGHTTPRISRMSLSSLPHVCTTGQDGTAILEYSHNSHIEGRWLQDGGGRCPGTFPPGAGWVPRGTIQARRTPSRPLQQPGRDTQGPSRHRYANQRRKPARWQGLHPPCAQAGGTGQRGQTLHAHRCRHLRKYLQGRHAPRGDSEATSVANLCRPGFYVITWGRVCPFVLLSREQSEQSARELPCRRPKAAGGASAHKGPWSRQGAQVSAAF